MRVERIVAGMVMVEGVEEIAFDALAGARDAIVRPGLRPRLEREAVRQRDQSVLRDLRQFTKRIGDDNEQRQQINEREQREESIDGEPPKGKTKALAARLRIERQIEGCVNHGRPRGVSARPSITRKARGRPPAPPAS